MSKMEYQPLTLPRLQWNKKTLSNTYGEIVAQPLEPGFGITLGNALRRVLLAAVEGSAVTSVIVKGVNNEFSTLPGIIEDVMQILLNIKQIVILNKTGKSGKMHLKISGKEYDRATVGNIVADEHVELINKDHILAHLAKDGELDITFFVDSGRGYQPAKWPIGTALQADNRIYLDAMFSPVVKVFFDVEKTRVGKDIDYDKLTMHIFTNGAQKPNDVLNYAVSILRTQLEHFLLASEIPFNEISEVPPMKEVVVTEKEEAILKGIPVEILLKSIDELELTARSHNCLESHGIKRVLDLVNLTEDEGLKIKNFGRKSLDEVKDAMKALGLSFGMNINEEDVIKALKQRGALEVGK
ncbi:TPA: DNA-directed RNA polymerase subunit alpha [Candidatus Dependentiae bacterium]|nr:MAG: DNA-directed RNA polymerase subunit alpha [candidate division TM6 bacterium GW2011_GWF2_36_131]KKQ03059.1 MAG: DNA-directed RNA polymerase subunit alpha [candidate division TM6 bacterium GW2011_GWE2_36_25]KKQ19626.1 MAG: DNA-directed RNA polymerase subunit alpha [candidate division TM6 bacterium GW2011_GWA2_36_9]HBR71141.1 DNA-directed RNA polymerase subunit alpha [Candidatus Dependentiae bacterium]HCU00482.1 DNA-directed RNA polymerase subunit alpha [Candidatus Dependentiae bacterium]